MDRGRFNNRNDGTSQAHLTRTFTGNEECVRGEGTTESASEGMTRDSRRGMDRARFNSRSEGNSQKPLLRKFTGKEESLRREITTESASEGTTTCAREGMTRDSIRTIDRTRREMRR